MRLELGCGANKKEGFIGLDNRDLSGVDIIWDMETFPWPVETESCEEVRAYHVLEHIERRRFFSLAEPCVMSEIYRILEPDGWLRIAFPPWATEAFWSDPTHLNGMSHLTFRHMDPMLPQWLVYRPPFRFNIVNYEYDEEQQEMMMELRKYG